MRRPLAVLLLSLLVCVAATAPPGAALDPAAAAKLDPALRAALAGAPDGRAEMLVVLAEQADLSAARRLPTKQEKGRFVFETLTATARRSQAELRAELDRRGLEHRSFWVANFLWTRGDLALAEALAARDDVARLDANPHLVVPEPSVGPELDAPSIVEWNIAWVNADDVWALGYTGQGAVVGGQDTGYLWNHAALLEQYRGWNGASADHDYDWHDAIHSGGGSCGPDSPFPCDDHGHGTHTMGTMVGDDGGANQVGMAPGARWIGCRNMNVGVGTPTTYSECFQWFIAPTTVAGTNPDPAMAPDVINNSWGCPPSEGCTTPDILRTVVENTRAAGIFVAVSAGNSGSGCSTVTDPAAIYDASFTVGSTTSTDSPSSFSSRGPVTVDGSNRLKPDIAAPGSNIRSSTRDGGYQGGWSGTSMAGPHVAGLVALLISANPGLAGDVDTLEQVIRDSAFHPLTSTQVCGGIPANVFPNNTFGDGRIDALAAVNLALSIAGYTLDASPPARAVCLPADADYDITVAQQGSFVEPVTLSLSGAPAGSTIAFSPNPVTPPGTSTLTVGTAGATAGSFTLSVNGISSPSGIARTAEATLDLYDSLPGAPSLLAPADGAVDVDLLPTFDWSAVTQGREYVLEVDDNPAFSSIDYSAVLDGATTHTATAPLAPERLYHWRVRTANPCGAGATSAIFSFTTRGIPPVLLVDDDDNGPDVRSTYTAALDNLAVAYDLWDTANSDDEPTAAELAPYRHVVWFSGDEFGGFAGPGAAGEAALAAYLDAGGCLLLSSQDYHYDRGLTSFMETYLGVASVTDDNGGYSGVTGAGSIFTGLGPYPLSYPFNDYSDVVVPSGSGELAMMGSNGNGAGVDRPGASSTAVYFAFPWEAISAAAGREAVLEAAFAACAGPATFTLSVAVVGSGAVTSSPAGIDCPGDCTEDYAAGTLVSLAPTPAPGWTFSGWSGDCTGAGGCTVTMDQARSVTASFTEITWTLDVTVDGPGTVTSSPAGIDCPGDCTEVFPDGTLVELTANPGPGAHLLGWSGDCGGAGACNLTMSTNRAVTAGFDTMPFLDGFESGDTTAWSATVP